MIIVARPKRAKFGNRKTVVDGLSFDSKREAVHWQRLKLLEKAGEISGLTRQVTFEIIPPVTLDGRKRPATKYVCDYLYFDKDGNKIIADAKGCKTPEYQIKRKLMKAVHGIEVVEL